MKLHRDEAYVLRTQPLGEADLIVTLFAAQNGKVRGVARSARTSRRRFGGLLEPLTRVGLLWEEKAGRELHRIEALEARRSFATMQADPALQAACAVLAELCEVFAHEGEADPKTFDLVGAVLEAFEAGLGPWIGVRYFEHWLLRLHGLLPDLLECSRCGRALGGGPLVAEPGVGALCDDCRAGSSRAVRLGPAERAFLAAARTERPEKLAAHGEAARPGGELESLLRGTLEGFAERSFHTYRHLRTMTRTNGEGGESR